MIKVRCRECGRMLGYFEGKGEVKCHRCGFINRFSTAVPRCRDREGSGEQRRHLGEGNREGE